MKKKKASILIVDDDAAHRTMLKTLIDGWGYETFEADDGTIAIDLVHERSFDMILMDVRMLKISGLEALEQIKQMNPAIPIIIMTAYASVDTAVTALKAGAYDYLTKPLDFDILKLSIERSMEHIHLRKENRMLKERLGNHFDTQNIIGQSKAMKNVLETVMQVAPSEATVMITGQSGTGKELIAGAIHYNSPRKEGPFVKINCAAITETLLESELFGHEKGAFTGADRKKEGKFYLANGGSLFLDEVSEMSLPMQVKLLRVLQEREITLVGGEDVIKIDVRLIVATNKNLQELIQQGSFREDLYYRLNVVNLEIPPLSKRKEDIPLLAQHFLNMFSEKNRKQIKGFTPEAMEHLVQYDWPGNVRELMNLIERGVVLSQSNFLDASDLPITSKPGSETTESNPLDKTNENVSLDQVEKETILKTLELEGGNKSATARKLGITRKTLHKKLKQYGVMP